MEYMKLFFVIATAITSISAREITQSKNTYTLSNIYSIVINGTSNLHNWNEKAEGATGDAILTHNTDGSIELDAVNIKINVRSIKSSEGSSMMDNNTYAALKADHYPEITFALSTPILSDANPLKEKIIPVKGNLTIAGVKRSIEMQVKLSMETNGALAFSGSYILKMSDYNVKAPTALFGTIKTGDAITIQFKSTFTTKQITNL